MGAITTSSCVARRDLGDLHGVPAYRCATWGRVPRGDTRPAHPTPSLGPWSSVRPAGVGCATAVPITTAALLGRAAPRGARVRPGTNPTAVDRTRRRRHLRRHRGPHAPRGRGGIAGSDAGTDVSPDPNANALGAARRRRACRGGHACTRAAAACVSGRRLALAVGWLARSAGRYGRGWVPSVPACSDAAGDGGLDRWLARISSIDLDYHRAASARSAERGRTPRSARPRSGRARHWRSLTGRHGRSLPAEPVRDAFDCPVTVVDLGVTCSPSSRSAPGRTGPSRSTPPRTPPGRPCRH